MGIRFHCPNGHKLNVKSFLAGKRGYCPKCNVKLRIPTESEPDLDPGSDSDDAVVTDLVEDATMPSSSRAIVDMAPETASRAANNGSAVQQTARREASPIATVPGGSEIDSDPEAHWYLCPPSGGQYGPVGIQTMRQWIAEGRVTGDSLVWRNGWPDWLNAGNVFDSLPKVATAKDNIPQETTPELMRPNSTTAGATKGSRRRKSERTTTTAVVLLLLAILLLSGALLLAVFG